MEDDLYALPPEGFVAARDELARRLRADGDRHGAAAVKSLRRPSVVAWAINQAVRESPDAVRELLASGDALRRAHEAIAAGRGNREELRRAVERERAAVSALGAATAEAAQARRRPLAPGALDRVRETLHAAALDPEVREAISAGRLAREADASDAGALLSTAAAAAAKPTAAAVSAPARPARKRSRSASGPSAEELRAAREAAQEALKAAEREVRAAEREADLRRRQAEISEKAVEDLRTRLADAEARLATETAGLEAARTSLRRAKEAQAAAQARLSESG